MALHRLPCDALTLNLNLNSADPPGCDVLHSLSTDLHVVRGSCLVVQPRSLLWTTLFTVPMPEPLLIHHGSTIPRLARRSVVCQ
jgi:hypothetical protein